jgi:hypothetical protein
MRQNKITSDHSSAALLDKGLGGDQVKSVKIGFKASNLDLEKEFNHWTLKSSAEMTDKKVIKTKVFGRLVKQMNNSFYLTISAHSGFV